MKFQKNFSATQKEFEFENSSKIKSEEWEKYYEYNLHDSELVLGLFKKFWPDLLEFSRIMQEPIFNISRKYLSLSIFSCFII